MRDMYNSLLAAQSLAAQTVTAAVDGDGVDLQNFEGAAILVDVGTMGGTTPGITLKIQESDDDSTYSDVADADLLGGTGTLSLSQSNDAQIHHRSYLGSKRYLRVICSAVSGTSPTAEIAAMVLKGFPRHAPTH